MILGEMPCAAASFLNCSSQLSKLPVFWHVAAKVGPARRALVIAVTSFAGVLRIGSVRLFLIRAGLCRMPGRGQARLGASVKAHLCANDGLRRVAIVLHSWCLGVSQKVACSAG